MGQVWVALGVQDLMGDQFQEARGMGINMEDSMEHLGKSNFALLENVQLFKIYKLVWITDLDHTDF